MGKGQLAYKPAAMLPTDWKEQMTTLADQGGLVVQFVALVMDMVMKTTGLYISRQTIVVAWAGAENPQHEAQEFSHHWHACMERANAALATRVHMASTNPGVTGPNVAAMNLLTKLGGMYPKEGTGESSAPVKVEIQLTPAKSDMKSDS